MPNEDVQKTRTDFAWSVAESEAPEVREALDKLLALAAVLPLQPRRQRWRSLTYCIVDAVWSIGAHYDNVVVPLVRAVAHQHDPGGDPLTSAVGSLPPDPAPLPAFRGRFGDPDDLVAVTNRQRTATRNGALNPDPPPILVGRVDVDHRPGLARSVACGRAGVAGLPASPRSCRGVGVVVQQRSGMAWMPFRAVVIASAQGQDVGSRRCRCRPLCTSRPGTVNTLRRSVAAVARSRSGPAN